MNKFLVTLTENIQTLLSSPLTLIALVGIILLFIAIIKFKSIKLDVKVLTRIGLALSLALILDTIKLYTLPNGGGSISLGSMVPLLIISFLYGPSIGMFTGFIFGLLKLMINPFILSPIQVLFDYPLPFIAIGLAGYFRNKKLIGVTIAMLVRFMFHFISGVVFFGQYAPEGTSPVIYSLSVNGFAVGGELLICLLILYFLPIDRIFKSIVNSN